LFSCNNQSHQSPKTKTRQRRERERERENLFSRKHNSIKFWNRNAEEKRREKKSKPKIEIPMPIRSGQPGGREREIERG
jgi:septum formation inhibitor MinC